MNNNDQIEVLTTEKACDVLQGEVKFRGNWPRAVS